MHFAISAFIVKAKSSVSPSRTSIIAFEFLTSKADPWGESDKNSQSLMFGKMCYLFAFEIISKLKVPFLTP